MNRRTGRFSTAAALLLLIPTFAVAAPPGKPSPVTITEVVAQSLHHEIPLSGTAEALRESVLSSRVAGIVLQVHVSEGDRIQTGQQLLSLDPDLAELAVASSTARVDEAIALHQDAKRRNKENQSLIARKAVANTSLASAVADEQAARAAVARQRAELQRSEELLARHTLVAPFTGVVAEKHVDAGQWVKVDSPVVRLVAMDRIRVRAALPQRYFRHIDRESAARVVFDALPGEVFQGRPSALVAVGNPATRSFPLLIELDNPQRRIAPGMSARVFIELGDGNATALLLPRDAIVLKADGRRIAWKLEQNGDESKVTMVDLSVGRSRNGLVEVLDSDLKAGDRVVLLGNENLRPGQTVQIRPAQ